MNNPSNAPQPSLKKVLFSNPQIAIPGFMAAVIGAIIIVLSFYLVNQINRGFTYPVIPIFIILTALLVGATSVAGFNIYQLSRRYIYNEARLQASEEQLRQFFETAPLGIVIITSEGRFEQANPAFRDLLGYSETELQTLTFADVMLPKGLANADEWMGQLVRGEIREFAHEKRCLCKDGRSLPVLVRGTLLPGTLGHKPRIICQAVDISASKQAETALRQQNAYLTSLHDVSLSVINRFDVNQLLESLLARAGDLLDTTHGYVDLATPDNLSLETKIGHGVFASTVGQRLAAGEGVGGRVWQSGLPLAVDDYQNWSGLSPQFVGFPFCTLVGVPLKSSTQTVGVLGLAYLEPDRHFGPEQIKILERFAEIGSLALDNANLFSAIQVELAERQRANLLRTTLYRLAQAASDAQNLEDLFKTFHSIIDIVMPVKNFYIALYDEEKNLLSFPYFVDEVDQAPPPEVPGHGLTEYILRTGQPLFCDAAKLAELRESGEAEMIGVDSPIWLGVPLIIEKKTIGVMVVQHYSDANAYTKNDLQVLEFVSSEVARSIDRKRAADELQRERNFALQVMTALGQGVTVTRPNGVFEYVNPAYANMLGRTPEDIIDQIMPQDVTALEDMETLMNAHAQRKSGEPSTYEVRLKHIDGHLVPVLITASPRWQDGQVIGAVAVVTDLSDRKQAEAALQGSEKRFRVLAENIPGVIYQCRNDDRYTMLYLNEAVEALTGHAKEEFLEDRLSFFDLYHPGDLAEINMQAVVDQAVSDRTPFRFQYRIKHKSGEWRWVEEWGTAIYDAASNSHILEGFISDITERRHSEEALRQSEERFRVLAENIPGVIFQCKNDDRYSFIYLNDAIEVLTGYPKEDFLERGLSFFDLFHPDDAAWMPIESRATPEELWAPYQIVYRILHKSGEWRWVEEWGTSITTSTGEPRFLEGFMIDITERKRTDERLARNARELAALDHMGRAVAASLDLTVVLKTVIDEISPLLQADGMSVLLPEGDHRLVFAAASGPASSGLVGHRIPLMAGAAGGVMRSGKSVLILGGNGEPQLYREIENVSQFHTRSLLAVPLNLGGDVIGVMEAVHKQPNAFNLDAQRLLEAAANWAAIAIGNARQHERIQHRLHESEAMAAISRALNETLDLPLILQLIVDSVRRVIPSANRAVINLFDEINQVLHPVAASGRPLTIDDLFFHPGEGIAGRVFAEGALINVGNTQLEPAYRPMVGMSDPVSLLSVPVQSAQRRLGTLNVDSAEAYAFSTDDERLLINLGVQAALAIENARLYSDARHRLDDLNVASEILRALNAAPEVDEAFPVIASGIKAIARCERVSLGLYDEDYTTYTIVALDQPRAELNLGTRLKVNRQSAITRDILAGLAHRSSDLGAETDAPGQPDLYEAGYRSRINLPLKAAGRVVGSLNLSWRETEGYKIAPQPLLEQVVDAMALAIEKNRLFTETTEALTREQRLNKIARTISGALGLPAILDSVTRLAAELTGADAASIALLDPQRQIISAIHLHNFPDLLANVPLSHGQGVAWDVIDSGKPLLLPNYAEHPAALPEWTAAGARTFLGVPIGVGQEMLGVLGLFRFNTEKSFSKRDVELVESVGLQAGVAIQNARLFEALSQEKIQVELLYNLSQSLTTTLDPHEVANRAIELTTRALGLELGSINLVEPGSDRIHIFAMSGYEDEALIEVDRRANMRIGEGFGGQVALRRKPLLAPDLNNDPYWIQVPGPDDTAKSAVGIPLLVGDTLVGVFTLLSQELNSFSEKQLPFLTAVGSSVALALQNARLFEAERNQVEALTALHETGLGLSTELDLPTLLRFIVERAARLLEAPMGALSLLREESQSLELIVNYNLPDKYLGTHLKLGEGSTGIAALSSAPVIVDDYPQWEYRSPIYDDAPFRALAAVPVKWRNQVMGVITVYHTQVARFARADAELVSLFADQAAAAIANARQHQELQRRLQESDALARISQALNETLDLQRLLPLIVEAAHRILPNVQRAVIHLMDRDGQILRPAAVSGEGESGQSVIMRAGEGVAGQVIAQGVVINVPDTLNDPRYLVSERGTRTRALLVAPVQSGRHRLGTLSVNSSQPFSFTGDDERLLGTLGTQAALAIYNAQLFEDTRRQLDELTLLNTIALLATEATTEDELIQRSAHLIEETFYPITFGAMLIDQTGNFLVAHESYRNGPPGYKVRLNEGVTGRVAATGQPWLVPDVRLEPAYLKVDNNVRSELCIPLKAGNDILGVVNAESDRPDAFSDTDTRLFTTLAGQLATTLQKLRYFRDLEQALKQEKSTRAQLVQSEKLAAMGRLVASVAHELNNPLQAIQNALYLIRQEPALGIQALEDLQVAATESDRMADLISRLRETYRPAASEEFRFESLNSVVTEVQKLINTHLRHNDIEFRFEPDPNLPYIPGVRDQLKQVLLNLSLNAVEAMTQGGQLVIRTSHDPLTSLVLLEVHDTGQGIAPDIVNSIFDPFFTTKETGTGLGLTITYDIIQRHQGRVDIESEPGQGTTFKIWLPTEPQTKSQ